MLNVLAQGGQVKFTQTCPQFTAHTGEAAAHRHAATAQDAVEDLLGKMVTSWQADELYLAGQMADNLRAPLLDLLAGATERLRAECALFYRNLDYIDQARTDMHDA